MRVGSAVGTLTVFVALAACGTQGTSARQHPTSGPIGTVTGIAAPCAGIALQAGTQKVTNQILTVSRDGRLVERLNVTSPFTYRLTLAPGRYVLRTSQDGPRTVVVHAGGVAHADFPDLCD